MNFGLSTYEQAIHSNAGEIAHLLNEQQQKRFDHTFCSDDWRTFAANGLAGLILPKEKGGSGCNALETALTLEGLTDCSCDSGFVFSAGAHLLAGLFPLVKYGSAELQERIFSKINSGEMLLANAMTESGSGSDAFALKTKAEKTGNSYLLKGSKTFVTNAPLANGLLVYAVTDPAKGFFGGISCFLLEKEKHDYKVAPLQMRSGYRNTVMGEVFFDEIPVAADALVGKEGSGAIIFHESMCRERACMALMHCGTMQRLIRETAAHVKSRTTAKGTLSDLQAVQFHLADMATQTEAARLLALKALNDLDSGKDATVSSARAKIACSEALEFVARTAVKLQGAQGFMQSSDFASEALQVAQAAAIYSGPNDVLRELIAGRTSQ